MSNVVIGIEGLVGSGKTSICRELLKRIPNSIILHGGNLYRGIVYALMTSKHIDLNNLKNNIKNIDIKDMMDKLGVDLILNQCSSVGEAFDVARKCTSIKTLKIDETMARKAVELGNNIAVVATVASTMKPSCNLVRTMAKEANKDVVVNEFLVDGALDILMKEKDQEKHNRLCLETIKKAAETNDVVVLAQGSMTVLLPYLNEISKPVLTSPKMAIEKVKEVLYG